MDEEKGVDRMDREMFRPKKTVPTSVEDKATIELQMCSRFLVRCLAVGGNKSLGRKSGGTEL